MDVLVESTAHITGEHQDDKSRKSMTRAQTRALNKQHATKLLVLLGSMEGGHVAREPNAKQNMLQETVALS